MASYTSSYFQDPNDEDEEKRALQALAGADAPDIRPNVDNRYLAVEPGNIDLYHRPNVDNGDGTSSSVRSMGVNLDDKEMLIPTVHPDGYVMDDDQAVDEYRHSGQNLGRYASPEASDAAAEAIHNDQAKLGEVIDPWAHDVDMDLMNDQDALRGSSSQPSRSMPSAEDPFEGAAHAMHDEHAKSSGSDMGPLGGGVGLALLADFLLNPQKGKNTGTILAMGAQQAQQKRALDAQQSRQASQDALNAEYKHAQIDNMGADRGVQLGQQELTKSAQGLRAQEIAQAQAEFEERKRKQSTLEQGNIDPETGEPLRRLNADERRYMDAEDERLAREQRAQFHDADIASHEKIAGMPSRARAGRSGGGGRSGSGGGMVDPETGQPIPSISAGQARYLKSQGKGGGNPDDPDAQHEMTPGEKRALDVQRQYSQDTKTITDAAASARDLDTEFNKYKPGQDIPGIGAWDSAKPGFMRSAEDERVSNKLGVMLTAVKKHISGLASPDHETNHISGLVGSLPGMSEDRARVALGEISEYARRNLRNPSTGRTKMARETLDTTSPGLADWALGDMGKQLGGDKSAPKPRKLRLPSGATVERLMDEETYQRALKNGAQDF